MRALAGDFWTRGPGDQGSRRCRGEWPFAPTVEGHPVTPKTALTPEDSPHPRRQPSPPTPLPGGERGESHPVTPSPRHPVTRSVSDAEPPSPRHPVTPSLWALGFVPQPNLPNGSQITQSLPAPIRIYFAISLQF